MFFMGSISAQTVNVKPTINVKTESKPNAVRTADGNYRAINEEINTGKTFTDSNGKVYPVFKTSSGKLYIKKVSAKTGKTYKSYLRL